MAGGSQNINSLIQGISQQTPSARGLASAEDQENCINDVLDGVVSRMGSIVKAEVDTLYVEPFVHSVNRASGEEYVVIVEDGAMRIFNKASGVEAAITDTSGTYLDHTGDARKAFNAVTVGDTSFLLNKQVSPAMDATLSAALQKKAIAHVKAGDYRETYILSLIVAGVTYSVSYITGSNFESIQAEYIKTTYIAEEVKDLVNSSMIPALNAASKTGFSVVRDGSNIIITSTTHDFDIKTTDGTGNTHFISFKDNIKKLTDLPQRGVTDYVVSVSDTGSEDSSRYYLKFVGEPATGKWTEVVAPATEYIIDPDTMPHLLVNTALNTFTLGPTTWGYRLAGDGEDNALNPSFIGGNGHSLQFISQRLAMTTEYEMILSRSRNAYVFFPDTVQTNLATAPVDYDVSNGSACAITQSVIAGGRLQFWGNGQQTYLDSGQDPIREETTEILPLSNYEYDGEVAPQPVGQNQLVFGTQVGAWSKATEVYFRGGRADGEIEITSHVPKLLVGSLRHIAIGEATKKSIYLTSSADTTAYLYQLYNQGTERVQSAWNKITMPGASRILWASIKGSIAWFLIAWPSGCTLEYLYLDSTGDETSAVFPLRLDHRLSEADATWAADVFTLALPYQVPAAKRSLFKAFERTDVTDTNERGREIDIEWTNDSTVTIASTDETLEFFFGSIPIAWRRFSEFFAKDKNEVSIMHDRLLLKNYLIKHRQAAEYEGIVTLYGVAGTTQYFRARQINNPAIVNNTVPVENGKWKLDVSEEAENVDVDLINRTVFPCIWVSAKAAYDLTVREGQ